MSVDFRIFPAFNIVKVTYWDHAGIEESLEGARRYAAHPQYRPDQKHLFDVSRVTSMDEDFGSIFRMHAELADYYGPLEFDRLMAYLAPGPVGRRMAEIARRCWASDPTTVLRVFDDLDDAARFLGLADGTPLRAEA